MNLYQAFNDYMSQRDGQVAASTLLFERSCMAAMLSSAGTTELRYHTADSICSYRSARRASGVKASTINQEVACLQRVMRYAGVAPPAVKKLKYRPPERVALTPAQKRHLFDIAGERAAWSIAYDAAVIAANTTMRSVEIRSLRVRDVDFGRTPPAIVVPRSKTDGGHGRLIPLNDTVAAVLRRRCADKDSDYFVVHPEGRPWQPAKSWRSAWASLTKGAGLAGLGFHALRHQAITEMAEAGVPDGVIKSIAGHVSQRMLEHYSHARVAAKAAAVGVLA